MVRCKIDKKELDASDIDLLEDFIVLATKDALQKIDQEFQAKMGQYAGMLDGLM